MEKYNIQMEMMLPPHLIFLLNHHVYFYYFLKRVEDMKSSYEKWKEVRVTVEYD